MNANTIPQVNIKTSKTLEATAKKRICEIILAKWDSVKDSTDRSFILEEIPVILTDIDVADQRELDQRKVNAIAANFNPDKIEVKCAMIKDNKLLYFDGQHLIAAIKKLISQGKLPKDYTIPTKVFPEIEDEYASYLFGSQDDNKSRVSKSDKFKAFARAGYDFYADMMKPLEERGITCKSGRKGGWCYKNITSPVLLERYYKKNGAKEINFILDLIAKAGWHEKPYAYKADYMILGDIAYLFRYDTKGISNLLTIMKKHSPETFEGKAEDWCKIHGIEHAKHPELCVQDYVMYLFTGEVPVQKNK